MEVFIIQEVVMAKENNKKSINAEAVANEVIDKVRKGKKINMGEILKSKGYSDSVSKIPSKVTKTKTYKETMVPVLEAMIRERDRALRLMESRVAMAEYGDLVTAADKLTKNIQLLSGKDTSKEAVVFTWEK